MFDEIEYLVSETFKHHQENFSEAELVPEESLNDGPGIIAYVEKTPASFRAFCTDSENIAEDIELYEQLPSNFSEFRNAPINDLKLFPCSLKEADYIRERIHGKRFYLQDDLTSNLITPSDYWWLVINEQEIEISFDSQRSDKAQRLGPLGEKKKAKEFFDCSKELFSSNLMIQNYKITDSGLSFTLDQDNAYSADFLILFINGEIGEDLAELFKLPGHGVIQKRFFQYLQQIAATRRFWDKMTN